MNKFERILKIVDSIFIDKSKPCPYWNFFCRRCMSGGHSAGFDNKEYCKYVDSVTCLYYKSHY